MLKPHRLFDVWTPDEVAECLDGVTPDIYRKLWALMDGVPKDASEVPDNFSATCLARQWGRLSAEDQKVLNRLAVTYYNNI